MRHLTIQPTQKHRLPPHQEIPSSLSTLPLSSSHLCFTSPWTPLQNFLSCMNTMATHNNNTLWCATAKDLPIADLHCPFQDSISGDLQIIRRNFIPPTIQKMRQSKSGGKIRSSNHSESHTSIISFSFALTTLAQSSQTAQVAMFKRSPHIQFIAIVVFIENQVDEALSNTTY